jgi:hypothetical protein
MSNLFALAVDALDLDEMYASSKHYYSQTINLQKLLNNAGLNGLLDDGSVLDSSLQNPIKFMRVTDAVMDYVNNNLDTLEGADDLLSALLDTEIVSADCFVPKFTASPNAKPGLVDVAFEGVGLALSVFGKDTVENELSRETMLDDILDEEATVRYLGRLTMYEDGAIHWAAHTEAVAEAEPEPEIPVVASDDPFVEQPYGPMVDVEVGTGYVGGDSGED